MNLCYFCKKGKIAKRHLNIASHENNATKQAHDVSKQLCTKRLNTKILTERYQSYKIGNIANIKV